MRLKNKRLRNPDNARCPSPSAHPLQTRVVSPSPKARNGLERDIPDEARICEGSQQLALGDESNGIPVDAKASRIRSVVGQFKRRARSMGRHPFLSAALRLLRETGSAYSPSTLAERTRKLKRINRILEKLNSDGKIKSISPHLMDYQDLREFFGYCKNELKLDNSTISKYMHYLDDVLSSVSNGSVTKLKLNLGHLYPRPTQKTIPALSEDEMVCLAEGVFQLDDAWWDSVGKTALRLYLHTGLRVSELRLLRLNDIDLDSKNPTVKPSCPKGLHNWANGKESAPIMDGIEANLKAYLEARSQALKGLNLKPEHVEPLFPFISMKGKVRYWHERMWTKLKDQLVLATGIDFDFKDLRPSYAQRLKDNGTAIEVASRCLRHGNTQTTEKYYARIRSETAFSQARQTWKPLTRLNSHQGVD